MADIARGPSSDRRLSRVTGEQCVGKARFALVEALGVERLLEGEELVVEVMTQLVAKRAEKAFERDDVAFARSTHPDADARRRTSLGGLVEAVQLPIAVGGALRQYAHANRMMAACLRVARRQTPKNIGAANAAPTDDIVPRLRPSLSSRAS